MTVAERVALAASALRAGYRDLNSRGRSGVERLRCVRELEAQRERLAELIGVAYRLGELSDAEYDAVVGVLG